MAADFKSHVLLRDEKGLFGIPFKRLLLAGVGAGLTYTIINLALPGWSIAVAVVTGIAIIVLTSPRGGIPLWNRIIYRLRGSLLLHTVRHPKSGMGQLVNILDLPLELVRLDGAQVFSDPDRQIFRKGTAGRPACICRQTWVSPPDFGTHETMAMPAHDAR